MCNYFRTLRPDEIEVRVQKTENYKTGVWSHILLYKDARVDMTLLDEHFGVFGWQREHAFKDGKNYCKISIYDEGKGQWISKEDVGTPSNTEADKGCSSDSFKRAAVNLGIGRELYSAPAIFIKLADGEWSQTTDKNNKTQYKQSPKLRLSVKYICYDRKRNISAIEIVDNTGRSRFKMGEVHDTLFTAKQEINDAESYYEMKNVWRKYPEYHDDAGFIAAKSMKEQEFNEQSNK